MLTDSVTLGGKSSSSTALEVDTGVTSGDYLSGFYQGTRRALYENNRDSITITVDQLNERSLGALIALYERAVGFYASLVGINAYHQPGVEAGKKAAEAVIDLQTQIVSHLSNNQASSGHSVQEIALAVGQPKETEAVYKILEHLAANNRGIVRTAERAPAKASYRLIS